MQSIFEDMCYDSSPQKKCRYWKDNFIEQTLEDAKVSTEYKEFWDFCLIESMARNIPFQNDKSLFLLTYLWNGKKRGVQILAPSIEVAKELFCQKYALTPLDITLFWQNIPYWTYEWFEITTDKELGITRIFLFGFLIMKFEGADEVMAMLMIKGYLKQLQKSDLKCFSPKW